jgi:hypothetical protein
VKLHAKPAGTDHVAQRLKPTGLTPGSKRTADARRETGIDRAERLLVEISKTLDACQAAVAEARKQLAELRA